MVPKSAVKKNRRDKQKQSRNDEETAGVKNKVVWRTLEEIFTLYDGIQAKHQQVVFLMEPEWFWKADFTLVTSELSVSAIFYLGQTNLFKFV